MTAHRARCMLTSSWKVRLNLEMFGNFDKPWNIREFSRWVLILSFPAETLNFFQFQETSCFKFFVKRIFMRNHSNKEENIRKSENFVFKYPKTLGILNPNKTCHPKQVAIFSGLNHRLKKQLVVQSLSNILSRGSFYFIFQNHVRCMMESFLNI